MIEMSAQWAGQVLVVGAEAEVARVAAHVRHPPTESGQNTVLVVGDDLRDWEQLAPTLTPHLWRLGASVHLVSAPATNPPPVASARRLGEELGIEVIAPDGPLLPARDGTTFVLGPAASWWRIVVGAAAQPIGPYHPIPWWAEPSPTAGTGWVALPAGGWLPGGEQPEAADPDDLVLAVPRHDSLFTMVVGTPGQPPVARETLLATVAALPAPVRERLLVVPYGPGQADAAPALADTFGVCVYGADGLPGYGPEGEIAVRGVGAEGGVGPRRLVRTWAHPPNGHPHVAQWAGLAELPESAPGVVSLAEKISVEAVRAGLWVREADSAPGEHTPRHLPPEPDNLVVLVGTHAAPPTSPMFAEVDRLLGLLTAEHREHLRVVVPTGTDGLALEIARTTAATWTSRSALLLDPDGVLSSVASAPAAETAEEAPVPPEQPPALPDEPLASPGDVPASSEEWLAETTVDPAAEAPLPPARVWPDQRSTAAQRHRLRAALGTYYDLHARVVARLLAQHPGLRVLPAGDEPDALMTDLIAVRAFLMGDRSSVAAALRSTSDVGDLAFLACLASGLRRLPSYRGVVYSSVPTQYASHVYPEGRSFWEPTFLEASTTRVAAGAEMTDLVVWSSNGRHVGGVVGGGDTHRVVFPAWSRFVVLGHRPAGSDRCAAVFLRDAPTESGQVDAARNQRLRERLEALTAAGGTASCQAATDPGWAESGELPGCDQTGRPYQSGKPLRG
ncbi:hypothetical protein [Salinispora tropica]|uniref:hypothetical protein n=1 Tax=Salinispora tropica TaxID=168695 RepID=UPI0002FA791C|nr:hypothetical protein [Salinispora tropica]